MMPQRGTANRDLSKKHRVQWHDKSGQRGTAEIEFKRDALSGRVRSVRPRWAERLGASGCECSRTSLRAMAPP